MSTSLLLERPATRSRALAAVRSRREREIDRYCLRLENLLGAGCPLLVADMLAQGSPPGLGGSRAALAAAAPPLPVAHAC